MCLEQHGQPLAQGGILRGTSIPLGHAEHRTLGQEGSDLGSNIFTDIAFEPGQGLLQLSDRHAFVASVSGAVYQVRPATHLAAVHAGHPSLISIRAGPVRQWPAPQHPQTCASQLPGPARMLELLQLLVADGSSG